MAKKYAFILAAPHNLQRIALKEALKPLKVQDVTDSTMSLTELKSTPAHIMIEAIARMDMWSYENLHEAVAQFKGLGFTPIVLLYARMNEGQSLNEMTIPAMATVGKLRRGADRFKLVEVASGLKAAVQDVRAYVKNLLEAEDRSQPHEPTEVDRIKDQQAREKLQLQTRQSQELLGAQQRELAKKAREKEQAIHDRERPREIVR